MYICPHTFFFPPIFFFFFWEDSHVQRIAHTHSYLGAEENAGGGGGVAEVGVLV